MLNKLMKARNARLRKFAREHVTGKEGGEMFGNFMSLEGTFDNAASDLEIIKELEGRKPSEFQRFCDAVPAIDYN